MARLVLEDLKTVIDSSFPLESTPDPLDREARDHEAFAETRRRIFIGRSNDLAALDYHAAGDGSPLLVVGESGNGKSALLANWIGQWYKKHPRDYIFQHYIGATSHSTEYWRLMARLIAEIKRWCGDQEEQSNLHEDYLTVFPMWLSKERTRATGDGVRFIIVLDGTGSMAPLRTIKWQNSNFKWGTYFEARSKSRTGDRYHHERGRTSGN